MSLMVTWCHSCQAWTIYSSKHTQFSDSDVDFDRQTEDHLGPFDGPPQVLRLAEAHLSDMLLGTGLPWDRSTW
jgi:hypothetical protein